VILRARWTGDLPVATDYLMSMGRKTKYAYRILAVERLRDLPHHVPGFARLKLSVERIDAADVLRLYGVAGTVVHPWRWDPRRKAGFKGAHPTLERTT
jgi:hypothetical protein